MAITQTRTFAKTKLEARAEQIEAALRELERVFYDLQAAKEREEEARRAEPILLAGYEDPLDYLEDKNAWEAWDSERIEAEHDVMSAHRRVDEVKREYLDVIPLGVYFRSGDLAIRRDNKENVSVVSWDERGEAFPKGL